MDDDEKRMLFNEINILKEIVSEAASKTFQINEGLVSLPTFNHLNVQDHPNIVKMYEFFEDDKRYYLVTEICKGGELFDEVLQRGKFSERDAAVLLK